MYILNRYGYYFHVGHKVEIDLTQLIDAHVCGTGIAMHFIIIEELGDDISIVDIIQQSFLFQTNHTCLINGKLSSFDMNIEDFINDFDYDKSVEMQLTRSIA